ncbi:putative spermidine/putrescine transport system permease protein [Mameliella alba]|uniref:ABC transporter permease n=1 Tax=Mameliella alba TaxID=561184 RepID=UPI000885BEB9|nr:ABC transporter permease subunit [Mameliella alba]PTR42371.1 putative spermidine/putrescine transport system permease protein [Mameliella alba]GGF57258.1 ABC transporter permease [Mameliella alba]SDC07908.1 putative spermidine/putrescine transport system permease protein [Mameliella alba]
MTAVERIEAEMPDRPARARPTPRRILPWLLSVVIGVLCVVPFLLVIAISFGRKIEGAAWQWDFTLANYQRFFVGALWPDEVTFLYLQQLGFSFWYAVIASLLAVLTALPFTLLLTRLSRRAQAAWLVFILSSLSLSEVFIVMGWDILLSNNSGLPALIKSTGLTQWLKDVGWFQTLRDWGLASPRNVKFKTSQFATILTMSYLVWPYAVILLYPALSRLDRSQSEAARTMGAGGWTVARTVILPAIRLPLFGSTLLLFVFLLGTYVAVTVFAAPAQHTTAVAIYSNIRGANLNAPFGATQAVILLLAAGLCLTLGHRLNRWAEAR